MLRNAQGDVHDGARGGGRDGPSDDDACDVNGVRDGRNDAQGKDASGGAQGDGDDGACDGVGVRGGRDDASDEDVRGARVNGVRGDSCLAGGDGGNVVHGVRDGQVEGAAAGGGGESQDCQGAMAVHLERKDCYRTVVMKDRGYPNYNFNNFKNKIMNNSTGVMDLVKVFEKISTPAAPSSSSSSVRSMESGSGAGVDNGGLNGKRKLVRAALCRRSDYSTRRYFLSLSEAIAFLPERR